MLRRLTRCQMTNGTGSQNSANMRLPAHGVADFLLAPIGVRKEIEGAGDVVSVLETHKGGHIDFELPGCNKIHWGPEVSDAVQIHLAQSHLLKDYIIHISVLIFALYEYNGLDIRRHTCTRAQK